MEGATLASYARGQTARVPLNFFAMPFGLAGLAGSWLTMAHYHLAPQWVGRALLVIVGIVWLLLVILYLRAVVRHPSGLAEDLRDEVTSPFASLALITPALLAAEGIYPRAPLLGKVLVDVFVCGIVVFGSWQTGQWINIPVKFETIHPGYFLPTVAGGFVASVVAAFAGYGILMALSQVRIFPEYLRLKFMPSTWSFTFAWAAAASTALHWLSIERPAGYRIYDDLVLGAITVLIGTIGIRTVVALMRHELALPVRPSGHETAAVSTSPKHETPEGVVPVNLRAGT